MADKAGDLGGRGWALGLRCDFDQEAEPPIQPSVRPLTSRVQPGEGPAWVTPGLRREAGAVH